MRPLACCLRFARLVSRRRLILLPSLLVLLLAAEAHAQVTFNGLQTTVTTGLSAPQGVAADPAGNVYVTDTGNNRVLKLPTGGAPQVVLASDVAAPCAVALDNRGNLYFSLSNIPLGSLSGQGSGVIFQMPAGGGTQNSVPFDVDGAYSNNPNVCGLTLDSTGNVFWADSANGNIELVQWTGTAWGSFGMIDPLTMTPRGVGVDASGNVYYTDSGDGTLNEIASGTFGDPTSIGTGLGGPWGVAVDRIGDVFASESGTNKVLEYPAGGTGFELPFTGLSNPTGVALDGRGAIYVTGYGNGQLVKLETSSVNMGTDTVGDGEQRSLSFNLAAGTTVRNIAALTSGNASSDFIMQPESTCTTGTVATATTCTILLTFGATAPGLRQGAVVFYGAGGQALLTLPVYGVGTAPMVAYEGSAPVAVAPGLGPGGGSPVAMDGAGDLFEVINTNDGSVVEYPRSGSGYGAETTVASNLAGPFGITIDGAGNLFVSLFFSGGSIVEIPRLSAGYGSPVILASGLSYPNAITVDQAGNVFYSCNGNSNIMEIASGTNGYSAPFTVATNVTNAYGMTVDADENLFVTTLYDSSYTGGTGTLLEFHPSPVGYGSPVQLAGDLNYPLGVWVEPSGSIVFSTQSDSAQDDVTGAINYLPKNNPGSSFGSPVTLATNLSYPLGIAEDNAGNIYFTNSDSGQIMTLPRGTAPPLNFSATDVGQLSSQTQIVTVTNIGNALLNFDAISYPASFPESASGANTDCFVSEGLEGGSSCPLTISFDPATAGALSGSLKLTDNNLNTPTASQTIALTGTGVSPVSVSLSATSLSFGSETVGSATNSQSVTMTNTGTATLTISSIAVIGANASSFVFANSCGTTLAAGASCSIHGHFAPTTGGPLTAAVTITDNAGNSPQTIQLSGTGIAPALTLSAASLSFASTMVGETSGSQQVTVTNSTSAAVPIGSIVLTGANATSFVFANSCGSGLAAGANCTIHGHFAPTATGALKASIAISYTGTGSPLSIALSGTGLTPPVTLSTTSVSFGSVDEGSTSASQYITLTNTGTAALTITSIALSGADASSFVFANSCGASLAVGANCSIHGHFAPAAIGALTATIKITDSASTSPQSIALTGTGLSTAPVTLSSTSLVFPATTVGTASASDYVTMTNNGTATLTISSIALTGADASSFVFANTCGTSLAVGANCSIHGHFAPTTTGPLTATITITDSAAGSPQTIALSGTGQ